MRRDGSLLSEPHALHIKPFMFGANNETSKIFHAQMWQLESMTSDHAEGFEYSPFAYTIKLYSNRDWIEA